MAVVRTWPLAVITLLVERPQVCVGDASELFGIDVVDGHPTVTRLVQPTDAWRPPAGSTDRPVIDMH